jgi:hypothetical protein
MDRPLMQIAGPPDRRGTIDPTIAVFLWLLTTLLAAPLLIGFTEVMPFILTRRNAFEGAGAFLVYGLIGAINGAWVGALVGSTQWLLLRSRLAGGVIWIGVTSLGWAIGGGAALLLIGPAFPLTAVPVSGLFLAGVTCGSAIGLSQWLVLRRHFHRAGVWPITTVLAWVTGLLFAGIVWPTESLQMGFLLIPSFVLLVLPNLAIFLGLLFIPEPQNSKGFNRL